MWKVSPVKTSACHVKKPIIAALTAVPWEAECVITMNMVQIPAFTRSYVHNGIGVALYVVANIHPLPNLNLSMCIINFYRSVPRCVATT